MDFNRLRKLSGITESIEPVEREFWPHARGEEAEEFDVTCSSCGGEFKRNKREGYSHCKDHVIVDPEDKTNKDILRSHKAQR